MAGSPHGLLDIFAISLGDLRENLASRWVVRGESLAGRGVSPPAVDQHFSWFVDELRDLRKDLRGKCDAHTSSLVRQAITRRERCRDGRSEPGSMLAPGRNKCNPGLNIPAGASCSAPYGLLIDRRAGNYSPYGTQIFFTWVACSRNQRPSPCLEN